MAKDSSSTAAPKKPGRIAQLRTVLQQSKALDPKIVWWMAGAFVLTLAVIVGIGWLVNWPVYAAILGLPLAALAATIVMSRRAEGAAYAKLEGQPGAAGAALTSLRAYDPVVWIAGGQAKGQDFDELVAATHEHMRAVVLLGVDRQVIRESLARHAPHVPIVEVDATDTGAMDQVVVAAAELAEPGDTVLLAPGCASRDMYADYAERGDAFADAARRLGAS